MSILVIFPKGDEDGEFELEEDVITPTEQSMGDKQESSESLENNAEDDQKDGDDNFLNQRQSSINYKNSRKTDDDKLSSKQASLSSSPISQNADGIFLYTVSVYIIRLYDYVIHYVNFFS
jgi:hypothetical protein